MGCDAANPAEFCSFDPTQDELPLHMVEMPDYYMDRYEVTNARYRACVTANICTAPQELGSPTRSVYYGNVAYDDFPVIHVTWAQADQFCTWSKRRLPTEAEWEKAARGGGDTRKYPWGDDAPTCDHANFTANTPCSFGGDTQAVGSFALGQSPYAIFDMAGNVAEWVSDWYDKDYYSQTPPGGWDNPQGPATGTDRVARGGSWFQQPTLLRVARRLPIDPAGARSYIGFRCARSGD